MRNNKLVSRILFLMTVHSTMSVIMFVWQTAFVLYQKPIIPWPLVTTFIVLPYAALGLGMLLVFLSLIYSVTAFAMKKEEENEAGRDN